MKRKILIFLLLMLISVSFLKGSNLNNLIIIAGGDINLLSKNPDYNTEFNLEPDYYFKHLKNIAKKGDIAFCNFEQTVSDIHPFPDPYPGKPYVFMGHGSNIDTIKSAGFNVYCLSNNHILDYGRKGLELTLEAFKKRGIHVFGAGLNEKEARKPLIIEVKGRKIAFFGYTEKFQPDFHAHKNSPGCPAYMTYPKNTGYHKRINEILPNTKFLFKKDFDKIRDKVDIIIASIHFGPEYEILPANYQIRTSREAIDAGAHIVLGHHPHVIQKHERYKNGLILYSLGNLVFPSYFVDPFVKLVEIEIRNKKDIISAKIHPFVVKNTRDPNLKINDYTLFKPVPARGRWLSGFQYMMKERQIKATLVNNIFLLE